MLEKTTHIEGAAPDVRAALGYAYAVAGNYDHARKLIRDLEKHPGYRYLFPYYFAVVYAGLGEKDKAFEYLDKEYKEGAYNLCYVKSDPQLDSLHTDPRFTQLLRRLRLAR